MPAGAASFQTYGPWQFKFDELKRGPDGHYQAVFTVRNASQQRQGFTITDIEAFLIGEDGRTVRRLGNVYQLSPEGSAEEIVRNPSPNYLEPGDQMRARMIFPGTKDFQPVQFRVKEPVSSQTTNTYPMR